jgi:hypothetical protein
LFILIFGRRNLGWFLDPNFARHLLDLRGDLAIVDRSSDKHIQIWVMKEYEKKEWVKEHKIGLAVVLGNALVWVIQGYVWLNHKMFDFMCMVQYRQSTNQCYSIMYKSIMLRMIWRKSLIDTPLLCNSIIMNLADEASVGSVITH